MREATRKQIEVMQVIRDHHALYGYGPSIREIGRELGIGSLRGVTVHLDALERKGLATRSNQPRTITLTPMGLAELGGGDVVQEPADGLSALDWGVIRVALREMTLSGKDSKGLDQRRRIMEYCGRMIRLCRGEAA